MAKRKSGPPASAELFAEPAPAESPGLRIISVGIENFKRVEVVEIDASGEAVEISGRNRQGKSSILDAIEAALGGKRHQPAEPIRRGAESARVVVDLGELVVERVWTAKTDRLVVKNREGFKASEPQRRLDELIGTLAFDPLAFLDLDAPKRREVLLGLLGLDFAELEAERAKVYEARRDINRDERSARARLAAVPPVPDDTPDEPIILDEVMAEIEAAQRQRRENEDARLNAQRMRGDAQRLKADAARQQRDVERLEAELAAAREEQERRQVAATQAAVEAGRAETAADALEDPDVEVITAQLKTAERTNEAVSQKRARAELAAEAEQLAAESDALSDRLAAIEKEKAAALAAAKMPVPGLSIDDSGVLLDGVPFEQASTSQQIRACTAISAALNPRLGIALVRAGNDLDGESLAAFYAECKTAGVQPWVERIVPSLEAAIVIEEGRVAGAEVKS